MTTMQTAEYKGRKYRLAWQGQTKYGQRAKLQFIDGSKEFWVDATAITLSPKPYGFRRSPRRPSCWTCRDVHDGGTICPDCGQED